MVQNDICGTSYKTEPQKFENLAMIGWFVEDLNIWAILAEVWLKPQQ